MDTKGADLDAYLGQFAGVLTAFCWSFSSIFFTMSGRLVGSPIVNRTRLVFALIMIGAAHWITQGELLPIDAGLSHWGWMGLSGIIGFVLGDASLFQAFVMIGPRLSMLIMALNPVTGAVMAWVLLGENLAAIEIFGIMLAISGVVWVVADRTNGKTLPDAAPRTYVIGVLFALGGALGQSAGFIASKEGLQGDFSALSGNLMRLLVSTLVIWSWTALRGDARLGVERLRVQPRALRFIFGGALAGPFIGVWFSLIAVQHAPVGIASTLTSLTPIMLIPLSRIVFKEAITWRAVGGTLLAITGTAILFLA
jgi:drug/metabolite transporter (DMT)-like permease